MTIEKRTVLIIIIANNSSNGNKSSKTTKKKDKFYFGTFKSKVILFYLISIESFFDLSTLSILLSTIWHQAVNV